VTLSTKPASAEDAIATRQQEESVATSPAPDTSSQKMGHTNSEVIHDERPSSTSGEAIASATSSSTPTESPGPATEAVETGELDDASFLSFEEWKKQTLEKSGQHNSNIGNKKLGEKKKDTDSIQNHLDSLGDEGELDLDFSAFRTGGHEEKPKTSEDQTEDEIQHLTQGEGRRDDQYRSKDAGKTCKERFSYASFDAGATIVKSHQGAKNSKAVLIENKDSYMLSECKIENKFLIIELSVSLILIVICLLIAYPK
jgi:hypothetical protein